MSPRNLKCSQRMLRVQSPIIPAVAKLIEQNPGTISLGQGVVYYGPPAESVKRFSDISHTLKFNQYGPSQGLPELINTIARKVESDNNIPDRDTSRIVVTAGSNMAFINALFAITDPGDEIILNAPYYFNHEMAVRMLDCNPVIVPTDDQYQLQADKILSKIGNKTRAVVTVSPNNPTGAIYAENELRKVNRICAEKGIFHISDEAYENFSFNGIAHFSPASIDEANHHTISLFSLSKTYGFASWRVGYMIIPEYLETAVIKAQDTNLICPPLASQYAALGALETGSEYYSEKLCTINEIRLELLEKLQCVRGLCTYPTTSGAFYLFLRLDTEISDMDVTRYLIEKHGVAVIPGHTFGMTAGTYIRVSYGALDKESATEGIKRLISGLTAIMDKKV